MHFGVRRHGGCWFDSTAGLRSCFFFCAISALVMSCCVCDGYIRIRWAGLTFGSPAPHCAALIVMILVRGPGACGRHRLIVIPWPGAQSLCKTALLFALNLLPRASWCGIYVQPAASFVLPRKLASPGVWTLVPNSG